MERGNAIVHTKVDFDEESYEMVDEQKREYLGSDWKDHEGLFESIAAELERHGLKLYVGDAGDDSNWIHIGK